jgi:hypothetical protein
MAESREHPEPAGRADGESSPAPKAVGESEESSLGSRRRRASRERTAVNGEAENPVKAAPGRGPTRTLVNAIRPSKAAERRPEKTRTAERTELAAEIKEASPPAKAKRSSKEGAHPTDPWTVPQSVRDRFVKDGKRYYFPDGAPAFKDLGRRLTTPSENTAVIGSLIEIAQSRGWNEITVSGTERFRQEAWRQARLSGIAVRGYRASSIEQAQLVRALARGSGVTRGEAHAADPAPSDSARPATAESPQVAEGSRVQGATRQALARERIVGKLLDHGRDTYRHDPNEEPSYFVRIETTGGKREIWGRDLERAMTKSLTQPQIGEEVTLLRTAREPVTVSRPRKDAEGREVGEHDVATYRNRWVIERSDFFESRTAAAHLLRDPSIAPQQAVGRHPELAGTYLNLRAAEIAARAIRDPEDQKRFVALVREALADQIERGEPLQPVRLRGRDGRSVNRDRQPVQARG